MSASETPSTSTDLSYHDTGVDTEAGNTLADHIKSFAKRTMREGALDGIDGFGALFELSNKYQESVLVPGTDGVGTKLRLTFALNRHDTVGQDLVVMSVDDILMQGAESLFFLDYFACDKLDVDTAATVVKGITQGCELAGYTLTGGETAEMPNMYPDGEYDLADFAVGAVEERKIIDGTTIAKGDVALGLASSGAYLNGYLLVRKIIEVLRPDLNADFHGQRLQDAIMAPTRIYVKPLSSLIDKLTVRGMAHVTGSGLTGNVPRVLQDSLTIVLHKDAWTLPSLLQWLQKANNVTGGETHRMFSCGIDMTVIAPSADASAAIAHLRDAGETACRIGEIHTRQAGEVQMIMV